MNGGDGGGGGDDDDDDDDQKDDEQRSVKGGQMARNGSTAELRCYGYDLHVLLFIRCQNAWMHYVFAVSLFASSIQSWYAKKFICTEVPWNTN